MRFKICGFEIRITFLFAAAITLMLLEDPGDTVLLTLAAACLHELGHLICMCCFGEQPRRLTLGLFGMELVMGGSRLSFRQEMLTASAGPLVNLIFFSVFAAAYHWIGQPLLLTAAVVHLSLALFNLLPIAALDGGRILYNFLCMRYDGERAQKISFAVSVVCLMPVAAAGFFVMLHSGYNLTLLLGAAYLAALLIMRPQSG